MLLELGDYRGVIIATKKNTTDKQTPDTTIELLIDKADARRLLALWYLRKSFFGVLFAGLTIAYISGYGNETSINWTDPNEVVTDLFSPLAGIIIAFAMRFIVNQLAVAAAFPVLKSNEKSLRSRIKNPMWRWVDRMHALRGLRALRWTRYMRRQAAASVGSEIMKTGKLDVIIIVANIILFIAFFVTIATLA